MPGMTARSLADYIHDRPHNQLRILNEQKYPKRAPALFMAPYYHPAKTAIKGYYRAGNDPQVLANAIIRVRNSGAVAHKITNNIRVLRAFRISAEAARVIQPVRTVTHSCTVRGLDLRVTFDLAGQENGQGRYLMYNMPRDPADPEIARVCIEISHLVLELTGTAVRMNQIDFVDIAAGQTYQFARRRAGTVNNVDAAARVINTLWPTI